MQDDERPMTHQESQAKWLQDGSNLVKRNAFFMKRALVKPELSTACLTSKSIVYCYKQRELSLDRADASLQDEDNLREALRFSAAMLGELRTSLLTPQKYFELYMQAFDELRHLEVGHRLISAGCATIVTISRCKTCLLPGAEQLSCLCRSSSRRSTQKGVLMPTSMSLCSMLATSCPACESADPIGL